jgi:lipopolysaccharide biosynthesis glycosyltransferase
VTRPTVVVVTGADAAYAIPLAVMLRSLVDALSPRYGIDAYVIDGGLGDVLRARIEQSLPRGRANLHWHVPDARCFGELPLWGRMTTATYFKLLMPSVLPPAVTRALWLDADVLAAGDVAALWHADVERFPVRAVPDSVVTTIGARFGVAAWRQLGLPSTAPYFNAGVMLVNVAWWRSHAVAAQAFGYLRRYWRDVYFWDQEGLNAILATQWAALDAAWNWSPSFGAAGVVPRLIHFAGNVKPWRYRGGSTWHDLYYATLDLTAWRGWRPPRSLAASASRFAPRALRRRLRQIEQWHMGLTRWRTLRVSEPPSVEQETVLRRL